MTGRFLIPCLAFLGLLVRGDIHAHAGSAIPSGPGVTAGPFLNPQNGHLYYLLESSNWTSAQATARQLGGHLVTINNDAECDWIFESFSFFEGRARAFWCGLSDATEEGVYRWVSGEWTDFENWAVGEPNPQPEFAAQENYVFLYPTANPRERRWRDVTDDAVERYLPSALWAAVEDTVFDCQGLVEVALGSPHRVVPRISVESGLDSDSVVIAWDVRVGARYQLQVVRQLSGVWRNVGTPVTASSGEERTQVRGPGLVSAERSAFYRILHVP